MQNEKIIAAIAEYLYHFTESTNDLKKVRFLKAVRHDKTREDFLQETATEIAATLAPLVEAGEPNWENAPHWANWVAQDENGSWFWYENEPTKDLRAWFSKPNGNFCSVDFPSDSWGNSLQERPQ